MAFEREGVPAVLVATTAFERQALFEARQAGADRIRMLVLPHPFGSLVRDEVVDLANNTVEELVSLLSGEPGRQTQIMKRAGT